MHFSFSLNLKRSVARYIKFFFLTLFLTTAGTSPLFAFSQQVKDAQVLLHKLGFYKGDLFTFASPIS